MAIEFSEEIPSLRTTMENIVAVVQPDKLREQIAELNEKAAAPDLWDDPSAAQAVTSALSHRQSELPHHADERAHRRPGGHGGHGRRGPR